MRQDEFVLTGRRAGGQYLGSNPPNRQRDGGAQQPVTSWPTLGINVRVLPDELPNKGVSATVDWTAARLVETLFGVRAFAVVNLDGLVVPALAVSGSP